MQAALVGNGRLGRGYGLTVYVGKTLSSPPSRCDADIRPKPRCDHDLRDRPTLYAQETILELESCRFFWEGIILEAIRSDDRSPERLDAARSESRKIVARLREQISRS